MRGVARPSSVGVLCHSRRLRLSSRRRTSTATAFAPAPPPNPVEALQAAAREAALSFEALYREKEARLQKLRALSNPWPEVRRDGRIGHYTHAPRLHTPEDIHIPHAVFRERVKAAAGQKAIRRVLRAQLLRSEWPKDVLKVVAVAMQDRQAARALTHLCEPIMRALYRCRSNVSDPQVLQTLHAIIKRFQYAKLQVEPQLLHMALKFAARSRSKDAMKTYLKMIRATALGMSSNVYRSVIAKFSIGHRGLGEIRNGRWKRSDLREVLLGFPDCTNLPEDQKYHFGSFLVRRDWQYLHGWVAVLARCREKDAVWQEWLLWKETKAYTEPRKLNVASDESARTSTMTNKLRGLYWFIEQMVFAGDVEKAWHVVHETGIPFSTLKPRLKTRMLDFPQFAGPWNQSLKDEMLEKYDSDLTKIEQALGVHWVEGEGEGEEGGRHELFMDQEEALEKLASDRWKWDEGNGYPWDESPIVSLSERELHDAEET